MVTPEFEEGTEDDAYCEGDPPPPTGAQIRIYQTARENVAGKSGLHVLQFYKDLSNG